MPAGTVERTVQTGNGRGEVSELERNRALVSAYQNGDKSAYELLFNEYGDRIYNFILRITGNRDDAAEATQEAFCNFLARIHTFDTTKVIVSAYLYQSARNAAMDMLKHKRRQEPTEEIPEEGSTPIELELDPERSTLQVDASHAVAQANYRLPERHRAVLAMRELEDMSYDDIARVLDTNINAVAQLISRARLRLRDEIRHESIAREPVNEECVKALPLMSRKIDGILRGERAEWLDLHLDACEACRENLAGIEEAGVTYRSWLPAPIGLSFGDIAGASSAIMKAGTIGKAGFIQHWKLASLASKVNLVVSTLSLTGVVALSVTSEGGDGKVYQTSQAIQSQPAGSITSQISSDGQRKVIKVDKDGKVKVVKKAKVSGGTGAAASDTGASAGTGAGAGNDSGTTSKPKGTSSPGTGSGGGGGNDSSVGVPDLGDDTGTGSGGGGSGGDSGGSPGGGGGSSDPCESPTDPSCGGP